ncbi:ABC transporter ATP-binding protein [Piscirickettsia litoralis]|uniref:ABC transporter domain-containing protein n=1 Tax=Piscirickettsia litoralis TaxID=1891921 RepID=A0ABX3A509_9GAMM|nr:ABC transporter ATP-binding protein [Piscirickettsia litoralis]ODN42756.1 hypothetical protein BGC07_07245 [Piscirickettsia litoralis]
MIEFINVSKHYKGQAAPAIDTLNLTIAQGDFFGLLGPNGSGKTTLFSMLAGLLKPSKGQIRINQCPATQQKKVIGFVPQHIALYPHLTVKENIQYFASLYGLTGKTLTSQVNQVIQFTKLEKYTDLSLSKCSGGIQRRANIAAGIVHQPQLLLLDEPTAHIDPYSRNIIFDALLSLHQQGTTLIYTSHYLEEVAKLCNPIAILDTGKVLAHGSCQEVIKQSHADNLGDAFLELTGKQQSC